MVLASLSSIQTIAPTEATTALIKAAALTGFKHISENRELGLFHKARGGFDQALEIIAKHGPALESNIDSAWDIKKQLVKIARDRQ